MSYLNVKDRFQIQMRRMEEFIDKENVVRFLDTFVELLHLAPLEETWAEKEEPNSFGS